MIMTAEEKGAWRQAKRVALALLEQLDRRDSTKAFKLLEELDLLIRHLQQIAARERRTGWEDDDG